MNMRARLERLRQAAQEIAEKRGDRCHVKVLMVIRPHKWKRVSDWPDDKIGIAYHTATGNIKVDFIENADANFQPLCPICGRAVPVLELSEAEIGYFDPKAFEGPAELGQLLETAFIGI